MSLIEIENCRIENKKNVLLEDVSWEMKEKEAWVIVGPNGGGKADFIKALEGELNILAKDEKGKYNSKFLGNTEIVSLEKAAYIIQQERENDESEYLEAGVDIGRTGESFILEVLSKEERLSDLQDNPKVKLCGVERILSRGLKYMSTGEIRRILLTRALLSKKNLLILSDPFAGLDVESRQILLNFFDEIVGEQLKKKDALPRIILVMERWQEIPDNITHVLEFSNREITFKGKREAYEKKLKSEKIKNLNKNIEEEKNLEKALKESIGNRKIIVEEKKESPFEAKEKLVQMEKVKVSWGDNLVIQDLSWTLFENEHWLIRGPNGSGKTTFLELITGDNKQVYSNDIWIFGIKRGSGESIWDIKKHLGIVSYRMHVEYRMLGGTSLENVIISGFRDSIGLYGQASDVEKMAAIKWLKLGGFEGREKENFGNLSYGEQRAVLILRSVVKNPKILILDEPCHGLDENYRKKILHLLEIIAEEKITTMLHVTHDATEILPFEKHCLELKLKEIPMYKITELN